MDRPESSLSMSQSLEDSENLNPLSHKGAMWDNVEAKSSSTESSLPRIITKKTFRPYKGWIISEVNRLDKILKEHCDTPEVRVTGQINYFQVVRRFNNDYETMASKIIIGGKVFTFNVDKPVILRSYDNIYTRSVYVSIPSLPKGLSNPSPLILYIK